MRPLESSSKDEVTQKRKSSVFDETDTGIIAGLAFKQSTQNAAELEQLLQYKPILEDLAQEKQQLTSLTHTETPSESSLVSSDTVFSVSPAFAFGSYAIPSPSSRGSVDESLFSVLPSVPSVGLGSPAQTSTGPTLTDTKPTTDKSIQAMRPRPVSIKIGFVAGVSVFGVAVAAMFANVGVVIPLAVASVILICITGVMFVCENWAV